MEIHEFGNLPSGARLGVMAAGLFLWWGMALGVWKFVHMRRPPDFCAPVYVDIAHRAALMYAFAALVLGVLAQFSAWAEPVNLAAVAMNLLFFGSAVVSYMIHGWRKTAETQFRDSNWVTTWGMWALIFGELVGTGVLVAGVVVA
jgi:hypothetical protein